jgi:hypothetical protein
MTETTTDTTRAPKFVQIARSATMLADPLPAELAASLPAATRKQHRELAERAEQTHGEIRRLKAAIADAPAADKQATTQAALEGRELPPPSESRLRGELNEAERIRDALETALRTSADRLLEQALPKAEQVAGKLERRLGEQTEQVRAQLAALGESLVDLGETAAQTAWTRAYIGRDDRVSPFRAGGSALVQETLGRLRLLGEALEAELDAFHDRQRHAESVREEQRQWREDVAREREQRAAAEKAAEQAADEEAPAA